MRIGLVIDYVVSEYAERIIRGVSLACQEKNAELNASSMRPTASNDSWMRQPISLLKPLTVSYNPWNERDDGGRNPFAFWNMLTFRAFLVVIL